MQERVGPGGREGHAEGRSDVGADLRPAVGAGRAVLGRAGVQPRGQVGFLLGRELLPLTRPRGVGQRADALLVVPPHPLLNGAAGAAQESGDGRRIVPRFGQDHGAEADGDTRRLLLAFQTFEFSDGVVRFDVHGGPP